MCHFLATFTITNTINATIMKVIRATRKSPTPNDWLITPTADVARFAIPGIAKPKRGMMKSLTSA